MQLAKALSDPARGLTALSRSGVIFTEQQREMILELQNSGREMEAQAEILRIVEESYKGSAKAAAEGLAGALDTVGQRFRDFQELLGTALAPIFVPLLEATEELVINLTNAIRVMLLNIPTLIKNLKIVLLVTKVWASTLIGIAAGKFFVALLANFAKIVKITKTLLTLEKIKLGYMKAQAAIQALLSSPKNLAGLAAGATVATGIYIALDKLIKDTINSIEDNFSDLSNDLDFQASLLKGLEVTKTDLTEINELLKSLGINAKGTGDSLDKTFGDHMKDKLDKFRESIKSVEESMADVAVKGIQKLEDKLLEFVTTGKLAFKDLANSIIKDMIRIAIQQTITAPFSNFISSLFKGPSGPPPLPPIPEGMAKGGLVSAGTSYLVGERGPELLRLGSKGGHITPNHKLGGNTSVVVNVDAKGGSQVEGNEMQAAALGRAISAAVTREIGVQKRPGGLLAT